MKLIAFIFIMLMSAFSFAGGISQVKLFKADSYQKILDDKNNQSFLLVLWSLDCSPCMSELNMLGQISKQHPDINLVFISTDEVSARDETMQLMKKYGLHDFQQWVFSTDSTQTLRYNIDPSWYGELPRSYFHAADGKRHAVTGRLKKDQIDVWYRAL